MKHGLRYLRYRHHRHRLQRNEAYYAAFYWKNSCYQGCPPLSHCQWEIRNLTNWEFPRKMELVLVRIRGCDLFLSIFGVDFINNLKRWGICECDAGHKKRRGLCLEVQSWNLTTGTEVNQPTLTIDKISRNVTKMESVENRTIVGRRDRVLRLVLGEGAPRQPTATTLTSTWSVCKSQSFLKICFQLWTNFIFQLARDLTHIGFNQSVTFALNWSSIGFHVLSDLGKSLGRNPIHPSSWQCTDTIKTKL